MANEDLIRGGTASVTNGQVAVAGQGVSWSSVIEGDFFGAHLGLAIPIAARAGNSITLAYPWPGPTQTAAPYAIQPKGDVTRFQDRVRQLIETLANGTVAAVAAAGSGADKISVYTGAGVAELASLTPYARNNVLNKSDRATLLAALGVAAFNPVQQGGNAAFTEGKVILGRLLTGVGLGCLIDGINVGQIWTDFLAAKNLSQTGYQQYPSGLMMQWGLLAGGGPADGTLTFPTAFVATPVATLANITIVPNSDTFFGMQLTSYGATSMAYHRRGVTNGGSVYPASQWANWLALGKWLP